MEVIVWSVRRILIPRRALDLLHRFLLPSGRSRLRVVRVGLGIGLLAGSVDGATNSAAPSLFESQALLPCLPVMYL